jgi:hypothetical protein
MRQSGCSLSKTIQLSPVIVSMHLGKGRTFGQGGKVGDLGSHHCSPIRLLSALLGRESILIITGDGRGRVPLIVPAFSRT